MAHHQPSTSHSSFSPSSQFWTVELRTAISCNDGKKERTGQYTTVRLRPEIGVDASHSGQDHTEANQRTDLARPRLPVVRNPLKHVGARPTEMAVNEVLQCMLMVARGGTRYDVRMARAQSSTSASAFSASSGQISHLQLGLARQRCAVLRESRFECSHNCGWIQHRRHICASILEKY